MSTQKPFTIVISGSRSLTDSKRVEEAFEAACGRALDSSAEFPLLNEWLYLHGGASGVDSIVAKYLVIDSPKVAVECIRPDYDRLGKAAPLFRNQELINRGDLLIAIWDGLSAGTLDTIHLAARKGIPIVIEVVR